MMFIFILTMVQIACYLLKPTLQKQAFEQLKVNEIIASMLFVLTLKCVRIRHKYLFFGNKQNEF
jgi:hypothetical protein